jgi:hypothetical protein
MNYRDVITIFEARQENLTRLINNTSFSNSKDREIRGALNELEMVIKTLKEKREEEFSKTYNSLVNEEHEKCMQPGFFEKILSPLHNNPFP